MTTSIETLTSTPTQADLTALQALLQDAVEGGASVGFLVPVQHSEMVDFWQGIFDDVKNRRRVVLVTRVAGRIVGSVQLEFAGKPNSRHRAELQKLLVLRPHRGKGLASSLMAAAEATARAHGRNLIVLDTSATGNALGLYARCGYTKAGVIPRYATDPDGPLIDTIFYYKELGPPTAEWRTSSAGRTAPAPA